MKSVVNEDEITHCGGGTLRLLQSNEQHWLRLFRTEMEQRRGLVLGQVFNSRFQNSVCVFVVGETHRRPLSLWIDGPLDRPIHLIGLVVVRTGDHALLVHSQLDDRLGIPRVFRRQRENAERQPFLLLGVELISRRRRRGQALCLLVILLGSARRLPIHIDDIVLVINVAALSVAVINGLRGRPSGLRGKCRRKPR